MIKVVRRSHDLIFYPVVALLVITTALIIIQPENAAFRIFTNHAVEIMFGILGMGLLFLFTKWHSLMFFAFSCTGLLCLFLKTSTNPAPTYAKPNLTEDLEVIHLNISNYDWGDYDELSDIILNSSADLVSVQEVTPDWDMMLKMSLKDSFPHMSSLASISFNGLAVFSKLPLINLDTFYHQNIPNLTGQVKMGIEGRKKIRFVTTYTNPSFDNDKFYQELKEHFTTIIGRLKETKGPLIAFGTYNIRAFTPEMKYFTNALGLYNSKRSINPLNEFSYEHIFHSEHLECSNFGELYTEDNQNMIGLNVKLQYKNDPIKHDPRATQ